MRYSIPFADGSLSFELPPGMRGTVATSHAAAPLEGWRAVRDALRNPLGVPTLDQLVKSGDRVAIAVTDATRACPDKLLVPPICTPWPE